MASALLVTNVICPVHYWWQMSHGQCIIGGKCHMASTLEMKNDNHWCPGQTASQGWFPILQYLIFYKTIIYWILKPQLITTQSETHTKQKEMPMKKTKFLFGFILMCSWVWQQLFCGANLTIGLQTACEQFANSLQTI